MEILLAIGGIYVIYLLDRWLDRRSADKFVQKMRDKNN